MALCILLSAPERVLARQDDGSPWRFSVIALWEGNDNRDSTRSNRENAGKFAIGSRVEYTPVADHYRFNLSYNPMFMWYTNPAKTDGWREQRAWNLDHIAWFSLEADVTSRLRMKVGDRFYYSQSPDTYIDTGTPGARNWWRTSGDFYDNRVFAELNYRISPMFFTTAEIYHRMLRYTDSAITAISGQEEYGGSVTLFKRQTANLNIGIWGAYRNYTKKDGGLITGTYSKNYDVETATTGFSINYDVTGSSEVRGKWGYTWVWYEADHLKDGGFPSAIDISLKSSLDTRMDAVIGYAREVRAAEVGTFVTSQDNRAYGMLSFRHSERWISTYRADLKYASYEDRRSNSLSTRSGHIANLFVRLGVNYRATEDLLLSAYYMLTWQKSQLDEQQFQPSYRRNTLGVRAEYTF